MAIVIPIIVVLALGLGGSTLLMASRSQTKPAGRVFSPRCHQCRYALAGLPEDTACPECGCREAGWVILPEWRAIDFDRWGMCTLALSMLAIAVAGPYVCELVLRSMATAVLHGQIRLNVMTHERLDVLGWAGAPVAVYVVLSLLIHSLSDRSAKRTIFFTFGPLMAVGIAVVLHGVLTEPFGRAYTIDGLGWWGWGISGLCSLFAAPLGIIQFTLWRREIGRCRINGSASQHGDHRNPLAPSVDR